MAVSTSSVIGPVNSAPAIFTGRPVAPMVASSPRLNQPNTPLRAWPWPAFTGFSSVAHKAGVNDIVFVAIAVFFLLTLETRLKRRRALEAIHELRSIAHVIDMHQLTKDPEWVLDRGRETGVLPLRTMNRFELSRYPDYCSEALSLTGKVAALYLKGFDDPVALQAVNEVEALTTGLSRKIWQKLTILYSMGEGA